MVFTISVGAHLATEEEATRRGSLATAHVAVVLGAKEPLSDSPLGLHLRSDAVCVEGRRAEVAELKVATVPAPQAKVLVDEVDARLLSDAAALPPRGRR